MKPRTNKVARVDPTELAALRAALRGLPPDDRDHGRGIAIARIADHVSLALVLEVLESRDPALSRPLLRALAVELAVRGKGLPPEHSALRALGRGDPSEAPPWLLPIEAELPSRALRFGSVPGVGSRALPRTPRGEGACDPLVVGAWHEITNDVDRDAITAPVRPWTKGSNGCVEARVFALEGARGTHADAALLRTLGLASVPAASHAVVFPISATSAFTELVSAGHGGTYNPIAPDAWARDAAWRSLRGLVGAPAHARPVDVQRDAQSTGITWLEGTPFFEGQFHALGIAVVSPARDRLAVLAAVDSD